MYLETMERLFGGTDKIILDSVAAVRAAAWCRICRSMNCRGGGQPQPHRQPQQREVPDEISVSRAASSSSCCSSPRSSATARFSRSTRPQQALVVRLGDPVRVVTEPGLHFKAPLIDNVI